jgi:cytochrome c oxidase subunit 2
LNGGKLKYAKILKVILTTLLLGLSLACTPEHLQSTFDPKGPIARDQEYMFQIIFWAMVAVFVIVQAGLVYTVVKFRRKSESELPKQTHGNDKLEIAWTIAPIFILAIVAIPTVSMIFDHSEIPTNKPKIEITADGYQWWWGFKYTDENLNIVTANELHIPTDTVINVSLRSKNVIHSFWIPKLAGKMDLVPNNNNSMWFIADEPGEYYAQCAEYCGTSHANMKFKVYAHEQSGFEEWVKNEKNSANPNLIACTNTDANCTGLAAKGANIFANKAFSGVIRGQEVENQRCAYCHTIEGMKIKGNAGPNLTHVASRTTIASGTYDNSEENLTSWITNPKNMKPGVYMPTLNFEEGDVEALVAYLQTLR